jgi:hypothetical protein
LEELRQYKQLNIKLQDTILLDFLMVHTITAEMKL